MENQHEKIKNYRDLTPLEIDLMNQGKELEEKVLEYIANIQEINSVHQDEKLIEAAEAHRWLSIGKTDIQKGFMAVIRAVAKPVKQ